MRRVIIVALSFHVGALSRAHAVEYGGETQSVTADELAALAAAGELDEEAFAALLSLHDEPPDPSRATPEELALLPGVGRAEARRLAEVPDTRVEAVTPLARADLGTRVHQHASPEGFARLRLAPAPLLKGAMLALFRQRTRFEALGDTLSSNGPQRELGLERWYVEANIGTWRLIAGNFNCGFGESVTFSSARRLYAPSLQSADAMVRAADARALGAAGALRGLAVQGASDRHEFTAFVSYRALDLYQYGEWQRGGESPPIILRGSGEALRYATLAGAARETLAGGNIDLRFGEQVLGATAYVGAARLVDTEGTWSPSSSYPADSSFGAVGVHAVMQVGALRGRLEAARTHSGGPGGVARLDITLARDCDVGLAARYYGVTFDNPFSRSVAAPDQMDGARARNERGVELSTALSLGRFLRVAATVDVWTALTAPAVVNGQARARTTWHLTASEALVLEGDCVDKDVQRVGSYVGPGCGLLSSECARGARASGTARLITERVWRSRVALGVRHSRLDVDGGVAAESRATAHITVQPVEGFIGSIVASERITPRAAEVDGAKRLLALTAAVRWRDWASLELTLRGEQRWDADTRSEAMHFVGALTLAVQR